MSRKPGFVSIGSYPSPTQRPNPARMDFIAANKSSNVVNSNSSNDGSKVSSKAMLHSELTDTLKRSNLRQRAAPKSSISASNPNLSTIQTNGNTTVNNTNNNSPKPMNKVQELSEKFSQNSGRKFSAPPPNNNHIPCVFPEKNVEIVSAGDNKVTINVKATGTDSKATVKSPKTSFLSQRNDQQFVNVPRSPGSSLKIETSPYNSTSRINIKGNGMFVEHPCLLQGTD